MSRYRRWVMGCTLTAFAAAALLWMAPAAQAGVATPVIGTRDSEVYHTSYCQFARMITDKRRTVFQSVNHARNVGRRQCKVCAKAEEKGTSEPIPADITGAARPGRETPPPKPKKSKRSPATSQPTRVQIKDVRDGDTLVTESGEQIRLIGVACPQRQHPLGEKARRFVERKLYGKTVELIYDPANERRRHRDAWKRRLAYVHVPEDGSDLGAALLAAGLAWVDSPLPFKREAHYTRIEETTRDEELGLWKPAAEPHGSRPVFTAAGGNTYHPADCSHLRREKDPVALSLNEAKAAGYRPCSRCRGPEWQ